MAGKKGHTRSRKKQPTHPPAHGTPSDTDSVSPAEAGTPKMDGVSTTAGRVTDKIPENMDTAPDSPVAITSDIDTQQGSRYSLRTRTMQNKNPAKTVGLAKRTRDEITTEVSAKKARKQADEVAKASVRARATQDRATRVAQLANLEDQYAQQQSTELDMFTHALESGRKNGNQNTVRPQVLESTEDDGAVSGRGFELADMAVDEVEEVFTAPAKKPLSAAEKRAKLRHSTLAEIAAQHKQDDAAATTTTKSGVRAVVRPLASSTPGHDQRVTTPKSSQKTPSTKNTMNDAFSLSWRKKIQQTHRKDGFTSTPGHGPFNPRKASDCATDADNEDEVEVVGGLHDEDVDADRDIVISAGTTGARARAKQIGIKLSTHNLGDSDDEYDKGRLGTPSPVKSATGSTKTDKSFHALPDFVKPMMKAKIIPSFLEYYGAKENVWDPDAAKPDEFLDLLKSILTTIFPRKKLDLKKGDALYKYCRQRIYDWHHDIQRHANTAVRDAIVERQKDSYLTLRERSEDGILEWLQDELESGAAYYGQPKTTSTSRPRDIFQSKYILKTLAFYLTRISGSVMPDPGYPCGALALCSAAVQRAFDYHIYEKPHGIKQKDFSAKEAAALTAEWLSDNVSWAREKSSRFEAIIDAAIEHMKEVKVAKKASILASSSRGGAPKLYEPPSSP